MKTAISIPDSVFEAADRLAAQLGVSRSELYATAVARFIEAFDDAAITEALDEIYADSESSVDPRLSNAQFQTLPVEDWS